MALQQGLGILPEWWIESGPRHPADFILARKIVKFAREAVIRFYQVALQSE
jgi:hypothetical protein